MHCIEELLCIEVVRDSVSQRSGLCQQLKLRIDIENPIIQIFGKLSTLGLNEVNSLVHSM